MPAIEDFIIGPVADVYVGDFGAVDVLSWVPATRTQGGRYKYGMPQNWEHADKALRQAGLPTVSMELTFYWNEDVHRISMTNSLTATNIDDAPTGQHYTILLLMGAEDTRASILIPECEAKFDLSNNFEKTAGTIMPISFVFSERNKLIKIARRGTYDELDTILGARSPI